MKIEITRMRNHHEVRVDGTVYIRYDNGSWHEKIDSEPTFRPILDVKEEMKLEKLFQGGR